MYSQESAEAACLGCMPGRSIFQWAAFTGADVALHSIQAGLDVFGPVWRATGLTKLVQAGGCPVRRGQ